MRSAKRSSNGLLSLSQVMFPGFSSTWISNDAFCPAKSGEKSISGLSGARDQSIKYVDGTNCVEKTSKAFMPIQNYYENQKYIIYDHSKVYDLYICLRSTLLSIRTRATKIKLFSDVWLCFVIDPFRCKWWVLTFDIDTFARFLNDRFADAIASNDAEIAGTCWC